MNKIREGNAQLSDKIKKGMLTKEQKKELKALGIKLSDKVAVQAYLDQKAEEARLAEEQAKKEAEEQAKAERLANPTTEDLLKDIRALIELNVKVKPAKAREEQPETPPEQQG